MDGMPAGESIRDVIDGILSRPEFLSQGESWLVRLLRAVGDWLDEVFMAAEGLTGIPVFVLLLFGAVLLAAAALFVMHKMEDRLLRDKKARPGPEEDAADEPWEKAAGFARRKEYIQALNWLFVAHLCALDEQGLIVFSRGKLSLDYERELRAAGYADAPDFRRFRRLFNAVRYGGAPVAAETFIFWQDYCAARRVKWTPV